MADLTPTLSSILVNSHSSTPISRDSAKLSHALDSFMKEAAQIVRPKYLQRDDC
jgi:hypothetical protein